jgi:hypothetical protein
VYQYALAALVRPLNPPSSAVEISLRRWEQWLPQAGISGSLLEDVAGNGAAPARNKPLPALAAASTTTPSGGSVSALQLPLPASRPRSRLQSSYSVDDDYPAASDDERPRAGSGSSQHPADANRDDEAPQEDEEEEEEADDDSDDSHGGDTGAGRGAVRGPVERAASRPLLAPTAVPAASAGVLRTGTGYSSDGAADLLLDLGSDLELRDLASGGSTASAARARGSSADASGPESDVVHIAVQGATPTDETIHAALLPPFAAAAPAGSTLRLPRRGAHGPSPEHSHCV